ncbi:O-antigen polymerase [Prevotella sp. P6B4]|uniref:O-antigen polymerase n=1 Tax=Prevotella sp. P6B4 TaxID=1410614 RepID=UPI00048B8CFC|nr:O-antigen polymerase [Prevotella sp. P6B4]
MLSPISLIFLVVLCVLIGGTLLKLWLSRDKSAIWSPLTFICLTLIYYIVIPSFQGLRLYDAHAVQGQYLFYIASVLFYSCVLIGFSWKQRPRFKKWDDYFTPQNAQMVGAVLFIFALACYVPFRGFRTTIWADDAYIGSARTGFVSYFIDLISLFCFACGLLYMYWRSNQSRLKSGIVFLVVLYLTIVVYIVGGFRYRLVMLILSLATVYHLFPKPKRINYPIVLSVGIAAYLLFAVMDVSRNYGAGLNRETVMQVSLSDAKKGAGENVDVCCFSIASIDYYNRNGGYSLFEPITTAVLMPIPRAIFPSKPDGRYMREAQVRIIGDSSGGAAFLCFAEAFISFGMIGVIIYGLFFGWFARIFFNNYRRNRESMGAILLLALFNGFCYQWLSRGYLAGNFNDFVYFVILPFWLTTLFRKILPKSIIHE